jgi:hypothetical protein
MKITINGSSYEAEAEERLVDVINRVGKELPQVCYHPQLGPIQTCDTCLVEINGTLARACGTTVSAGMDVATESVRAKAAQREAFDRILGNHTALAGSWNGLEPIRVLPDVFGKPGESLTIAVGTPLFHISRRRCSPPVFPGLSHGRCRDDQGTTRDEHPKLCCAPRRLV